MSDTMSDPVLDEDDDGSVVEDAFLAYRDAGLRLPPVPRELADALEDEGDLLYATQPCDLLDRAAFLSEAAKSDAPHQVAFGHVGHGANSWFWAYRLILDPLAVFVRLRFGGAYDEQESGRAIVNGTAATLEEMVVLADAARADGRLAAGARLIVVEDGDAGGWKVGDGGWRSSSQPIDDAMAFLSSSG